MSIYNVLSLVVVIVAHYGLVNYACVWKKRGSPAAAVWQGEGDLGIGEPALLVVTGRFAHGPSRATRARWPDLQATASAADPLDFCSLVDLYCLCYSMLPCDCDCRGCCGCRMFCWRVECCCCCCRAVVVAVVVIVLICFSMLLLLFL